MKNSFAVVAVLIATSIASAALAQGGSGPGRGGRFAFGPNNTAGWAMMTPEERTEHRQKMRSFATYDECKAYQAEHHQAMEARAKEQGKVLPAPRANACDRMKARGLLK